MNINRFICIFAVALAGCGGARESPESVIRAVHVEGASVTVNRLHASATWDTMLDQVEKGDVKWIAVMPLLVPGASGPTKHDLQVSLAFGLQHNARPVLLALSEDGILSVQAVCGWPFDDSDKPSSSHDYEAGVTDAVTKVSAVGDDKLKSLKVSCLIAMERQKQ